MKITKAELHAAEVLPLFIEACSAPLDHFHNEPLEKLLWLYENDLGTSEDVAKEHPELKETMREIARIYQEEVAEPLQRMAVLMKKVERVSPKY